MVYLPIGININTLEEHAQAAVGQLIKDDSNCYSQMVKFICYSYLALCHMDTPVPRSVCSQSCDALMMKCHNTTFSNIKNDLPEWSINRNCSKLRQTKQVLLWNAFTSLFHLWIQKTIVMVSEDCCLCHNIGIVFSICQPD